MELYDPDTPDRECADSRFNFSPVHPPRVVYEGLARGAWEGQKFGSKCAGRRGVGGYTRAGIAELKPFVVFWGQWHQEVKRKGRVGRGR